MVQISSSHMYLFVFNGHALSHVYCVSEKMKANTKADANKHVMDEIRPWQDKRRSREEKK